MGRQDGESCVGVGERLEMRGAAWTWKQGGRTTTRQGVKLRELFSRKKVMRGRGFARIWRENDKGNLFRVTKQLVNRNRDIVGANCVKDSEGKFVVEEDRLMEVWREHYEVL